MDAILGAIVAYAAAAAASPVVLRIIKSAVIDVPNERSSHSEPTPRGGGIALVIGVAAGLAASRLFDSPIPAAFAVAASMGVLGLVEDTRGLGIAERLAFQAAAGAVSAAVLLRGTDIPPLSVAVAAVAILIWVVGFINAFNFMDGINGISAAQLIVAGTLWAAAGVLTDSSVMTTLGVVTAGASLGYLPWNFPHARFFIGDVGAYFAGAWLAIGSVLGIRLGIHPVVMVSPLLLYGADTTFTLLQRLRRHELIHNAHRSHVYQRLVTGGWSHVQTTLFFVVSASGSAAAGLLWLTDSVGFQSGALALMGGMVAIYMAAPSIWGKKADHT